MKRKIMISVILLILYAVTSALLPFFSEKKYIYELSNYNNIAVMVYDDDYGEYVKQNSIPTGDYEINTELSHCDTNGQILSYDSTLGSVSVKMDSADQCYFYFDIANLFDRYVDFEYSGSEQTWTVPKTGRYKIEVWGAQGGTYDDSKYGGYGAYATGIINLTKDTILHINVGGTTTSYDGGYNGGGSGSISSGQTNALIDKYYGGGGATSISLSTGTLYSLGQNNKQNDVIIVAGGGGGAYVYSSSFIANGGHAGGIQGNNGSATSGSVATGGTQSSGGIGNNGNTTYNGTFGRGGNGANGTNYSTGALGTGGGGGWYGGGGTYNVGSSSESGAGGSSYIGNSNLRNKHMTCYGCTESAQSNTNTYTISNSCVSDKATSDCSKTGNGYVRITYKVDTDPSAALIPKPMSSNTASDGGVASAYIGGSSGTATSGTGTTHAPYLYYAFDNNLSTAFDDYYGSNGNISNSQITYQFPKKALVNKVSISNDNGGFDRYLHSVKVQRSDDGTNWTDVYTITGMETNATKTMYDYEFENTVPAKYWRLKGLTTNNGNKWQIQELQYYGYYPVEENNLKFHMDSKTFNGSSDYVNTGVYLFNSENVNKDFLVTFNIASGTYATGYNSLFNAFDEAKQNGYYYGVIFRYHPSNSSYYQIVGYINDSTNTSSNVAISGTTNVRIKRESKVISYSINNGSWTTLQSFASTNATVTTPATFGSSWNGSGPYRYFTGTLTDMNIYVYD